MSKIERVNKSPDAWRRIAVKPITGNKADILVALANVSRAENDKLTMYEFVGLLVDTKWNEARARGLVFDNMLQINEKVTAVVEIPEVVIPLGQFNEMKKAE